MRVDTPARLGETRLPDGRVLGWAEWGPPDGVPVLLCPGAATSRRLGFGTDVVDALGVRLISVDRPGLGVSTPAADVRRFADDVRRVVPDRPRMVGNSQGAPFALACAAAGVVSALAVVSGADEVAAPEFAPVLPADLRRLVEKTASDPSAAEKHFATLDADAMWNMVMAGSPASDLAVYRHPVFADAYRRALDEGFAQGADGYARDTVLAMGRWPIALSEITVPVDLWYGAEDTSHSPDNGAFLATRIPGAHRHVVPDIGAPSSGRTPNESLPSSSGDEFRPGDVSVPLNPARETTEDTMTTAPSGRPPVVDMSAWQAARDELLAREKAHTREGDAIAAARRRLPMVEFDGTVEVVGPDGPVPFLDLFEGRDELVVYKHMWHDGAPHQGQCEGCTTTAWHVHDASYLTPAASRTPS
nr:alpha/beta fold hydrolase [Actinomadura sp. CNU-125]